MSKQQAAPSTPSRRNRPSFGSLSPEKEKGPSALFHPLKIGTDCSGMETPVMALKKLGVPYEHMFSCDIDAAVKKQILENFPPKKWYDDLMTRDNHALSTPAVGLYVA